VATIANGASQSDILDLGGYTMAGIATPSAWTTAAITFLVAQRPTDTFLPLYTEGGTEVSVTVAVSRGIGLTALPAEALAAWRYVRLRSGTAATPVNQGAARTIIVALKA
jgi:hypothetical protein